ncbi:hypothetical protein GYMLUDRAFT_776953 [Collybiopsis luxurians FD-317 M1]|uniref:Arylformamidase n=1 Tax=Collybiopsis luxurians FD-317 M1 TaxID=944289 RepID=A0A0D0C3I6_9AGAR|nr:hypothetical protein GYMLUDRAFT_776953 [Collybiopsis luxurians FD-317 M1]
MLTFRHICIPTQANSTMPPKRELVDLSHSLDPNHISLWRTMPRFTCHPFTTIAKDTFSIHTISMGTHTGTHVDAPSHFIDGGKSIDQIPLDTFHGPALVIHLPSKQASECISWEKDLRPYVDRMHPGVIVLLHTGWSQYWTKDLEYFAHPYVEPQAAKEMLKLGVQVVGLDTPNPDQTGVGGHPFHEVFLGGGGVIVENLTNLDKLRNFIEPTVNLAPISIVGTDGAPVRGVAWDAGKRSDEAAS